MPVICLFVYSLLIPFMLYPLSHFIFYFPLYDLTHYGAPPALYFITLVQFW